MQRVEFMWVIRQLVRLLGLIAIAVLIAIAIAWIIAAVRGGETRHTLRTVLLVLGALFLVLGGTDIVGDEESSFGENWDFFAPHFVRWVEPRPDERQLRAGAVFLGSGIVLLVLGRRRSPPGAVDHEASP